ncbi:MAG TPA: hypothetical protein VKI19_00255 [Acidimicrobiales bacterium]|nr:hypothetical protein [Acidimicrobiales bacterium]
MPRSLTTLFALAAAPFAVLAGAAAVSPPPAAAAVLPPANPGDSQPSPAMVRACQPPTTASACDSATLAAVNQARAAEGIGPMALPSNYRSLSAPEQLLVVLDLERVDRGLAPIAGLTPALDQDALYGARNETDPPLPAGASSAASIWLGGYATPLFDDFFWMYDDGPGGVSDQCCWAHRDAVLQLWPGSAGNVLMGAAVTSTSQYPASAGVVVASGMQQSTEFTWASETGYLGFSPSPGTVDLGASPGQTVSGAVSLYPSGQSAVFSASLSPLSGDTGQWSLLTSSCSAGAGRGCRLAVSFRARSTATVYAALNVRGPHSSQTVLLHGGPFDGYWLGGADGGIFSYGTAQFAGSTGGIRMVRPVVGMAGSPDHQGYWTVASDGGVFSFGDARFHGSTGGVALTRPVVGMAADPSGPGYWLTASDGGVFSFGAARFQGSTGGVRLVRPVVAIAADPTGPGYWLVASDGGVFSFGAARFYGSTGGIPLRSPVVGIAPTADGRGYWLVAKDGGVFAFGDARFLGSAAGLPISAPVIGLVRSQTGTGYWMAGADGSVFSYGRAPFHGSAAGAPLSAPVVAIGG